MEDNCLHSFRTEEYLKSQKKVSENKDFCRVVMPFEDTKILQLNQYLNSDKMLYIIYEDFESPLKRRDGLRIIPKIFSSMSTIWEYDGTKNNVYKVEYFS